MKEKGILHMEYSQVKERVAKEKAALGKLVAGTGVGMLLFFLGWIFLGR